MHVKLPTFSIRDWILLTTWGNKQPGKSGLGWKKTNVLIFIYETIIYSILPGTIAVRDSLLCTHGESRSWDVYYMEMPQPTAEERLNVFSLI